MSHFASSEDQASPDNPAQIERFGRVRALIPDIRASLCNSSGIYLSSHPWLDLARPGYALYGGNPTPGRANPMKPVVSLQAPILQTRTIEAGAHVGYNGQWTARRSAHSVRTGAACVPAARGTTTTGNSTSAAANAAMKPP